MVLTAGKEGGDEEMGGLGLESVVAEARTAFENGKTKGFDWRNSQLKSLLRFLQERESELLRVLKDDLGKHRVEAFRDEVRTSSFHENVVWHSMKFKAFASLI